MVRVGTVCEHIEINVNYRETVDGMYLETLIQPDININDIENAIGKIKECKISWTILVLHRVTSFATQRQFMRIMCD